jgi:hypothetical protein
LAFGQGSGDLQAINVKIGFLPSRGVHDHGGAELERILLIPKYQGYLCLGQEESPKSNSCHALDYRHRLEDKAKQFV